jgi:uncharacterized protein YjbI with pentapeptide repeats
MNKIIIVDKNKELIEEIKKLDLKSSFYDVVVSDEDNVFSVKKKYPLARIVTASNPSFSAGGGLDFALKNAFPEQWEKAKEFHRTKDLLFVVSVNENLCSSKEIVQRALVGVSGYSYECDLIITGIGTGIGGLSIDNFCSLFNDFLSREFNYAQLNDAELNNARLNYAQLNDAELNRARLNYAQLNRAELNRAELNNARLNYAQLNRAELNSAELNRARLNYAELNDAELNDAELNDAKLNNMKGVVDFSPSEWFNNNFVATEKGYIVYKAMGNTTFEPNENWIIEEGSVLTEVVNSNITNNCGCGVNFGTKTFCKKNYPDSVVWECLIPWERLADVIVPIHTDGKARTRWLQLLRKVKK